MKIELEKRARKQLKKLPQNIQAKARKAFKLLIKDYRHNSLRTRKMSNEKSFEARIDFHYRFTFMVEDERIFILTIGMHDTGLGVKDQAEETYTL